MDADFSLLPLIDISGHLEVLGVSILGKSNFTRPLTFTPPIPCANLLYRNTPMFVLSLPMCTEQFVPITPVLISSYSIVDL